MGYNAEKILSRVDLTAFSKALRKNWNGPGSDYVHAVAEVVLNFAERNDGYVVYVWHESER